MVAGMALLVWGLVEVLHTGSCASGGAYVVARQCPDDIALQVGAIIAGVPVFLLGGWLFASRGRTATEPGLPPVDDPVRTNPRPFGSYDN